MKYRVLRDVIGWDVRNWRNAIAFWEQHVGRDLRGLHGLELGCGRNGGLSLWLALRGCHVVCSGWPRIEPQPQQIHRHYDVDARITYAKLDARAIPFASAFDLICFKSMLGGIARGNRPEEAGRVMASIERALKPGGYLLFAENLTAARWHGWLRRRYGSGRDGWRYFTREELQTQTTIFAECRFTTFGYLGLLGRREWQRDLLARIDSCIVPMIPSENRYGLAAVCRKPS